MSTVRITPRGRTRVRLLLLVGGLLALFTAFVTAIRAGGAPWAIQIAIYEVGVGAAALLSARGIGRESTGPGSGGPAERSAGGATALVPWIVLAGFLLIGALFGLAHMAEILSHFQTTGTRGGRRGLAQLIGGFFWGGVVASAVLVQWQRPRHRSGRTAEAHQHADTAQGGNGTMDVTQEPEDPSSARRNLTTDPLTAETPQDGRIVLADTDYWTFRTKALLWGATVLLGFIGAVFVGGVQTSPSYALAAGGLLGIAGALGVWAARMTFRSAHRWSPWWSLAWLVVCSGIGCAVALVV